MCPSRSWEEKIRSCLLTIKSKISGSGILNSVQQQSLKVSSQLFILQVELCRLATLATWAIILWPLGNLFASMTFPEGEILFIHESIWVCIFWRSAVVVYVGRTGGDWKNWRKLHWLYLVLICVGRRSVILGLSAGWRIPNLRMSCIPLFGSLWDRFKATNTCCSQRSICCIEAFWKKDSWELSKCRSAWRNFHWFLVIY